MIDLRSDTITKPSAEMRQAMFEAEVGDDVFGEDPTVNRLQREAAALFGKEAALFVSSGVMGNQLAIKSHTSPGNEVLVESESHIFHYEGAAPSILSGVQLRCVPGVRGIVDEQSLEKAIRSDEYYFPRTALVAIENTHNRAGGTVYPIETITRIASLCDSRRIALHLDGARLWNAHIATGVPLAEYAARVASLSVCFSKGLGAPVGSILCGSKAFIERARVFRKIIGGGMRQAGILAAAALYAMKHNVSRLKEDHEKAKFFSGEIAKLPAFTIDAASVQTNIVIIDCAPSGKSPEAVLAALQAEGVLLSHGMPGTIRAVFHLDVSLSETERAADTFKKLFQ